MKTSKNALKHVLHSPGGLLFISSLTHTTLSWVMCLTKRGASFRQVVKNMWQVGVVYGKKKSNAFLFKVHFLYLNGESISKLVISSTITTLTSQRMPSCTSKRYTERLHVFLAVDWKRMMHWQAQSDAASLQFRNEPQELFISLLLFQQLPQHLRTMTFCTGGGVDGGVFITEEDNFGSHGNQGDDEWWAPNHHHPPVPSLTLFPLANSGTVVDYYYYFRYSSHSFAQNAFIAA